MMRISVRGLVFALLLGLSTSAIANYAVLGAARLSASPQRTRMVFDLNADTQPDMFLLANPLRLVIDLPDTRAARERIGEASGSGLISRIDIARQGSNGLRIVLGLKHMVQPHSVMLNPDREHGYRLVVDLLPQGSGRDPAAVPQDALPAVAGASRQTTVGDSRRSDDDSTTADKTAAALAQAASAASDDAPPPVRQTQAAASVTSAVPLTPLPGDYGAPGVDRDIVIAIDPGHGGKDPGAHGAHGTLEKNITLSVARRLERMVDDQPHMHAVLTRRGDYYVALRQRMEIARHSKADFFISIHCDASPGGNDGAVGASVYALSGHGATSEHARWLARRENGADLVGGISLRDKNSSLASFMLDLSQSASIEASMDAGKRVLAELDDLGSLHKSRVQQAGFMVLKSPDIPSILVETNFISNPREEEKLDSADYQNALAAAILRGIKGYFASYRPASSITAGQQYRVRPGESLSQIAQTFGVSLAALRRANSLDSNAIEAGTVLQIPAPPAQQMAGLG